MRDRKSIIIVAVALIISVIGLGVALATFSTTLTINGSASVEASNWDIVFEGITNTNVIDDPVLTGSAKEVTHPTIKNNSTEISNYSVTFTTPGDSVTYNFKIHNKGDYAADVSTLTIAGVTNPPESVRGASLVTDSSIATANTNTLNVTYYQLYYTDSKVTVGQDDAKDCLEPGETVNVTLKIWFSYTYESRTNILPASDLTLDNLGVSILYNQHANGLCYYEGGERETVTDETFVNYGGAYYTFEGKRFIGTGVDNLIITENILSRAQYASYYGTDNGDGTYTFEDHPAADAAASYCTGCRLMTKAEATSWGCSTNTQSTPKCAAKNEFDDYWWLADVRNDYTAWAVGSKGYITHNYVVNGRGVRPVVSISSSATMTGSGTSASPYVITQ